jgi:hypothetical protein
MPLETWALRLRRQRDLNKDTREENESLQRHAARKILVTHNPARGGMLRLRQLQVSAGPPYFMPSFSGAASFPSNLNICDIAPVAVLNFCI